MSDFQNDMNVHRYTAATKNKPYSTDDKYKAYSADTDPEPDQVQAHYTAAVSDKLKLKIAMSTVEGSHKTYSACPSKNNK